MHPQAHGYGPGGALVALAVCLPNQAAAAAGRGRGSTIRNSSTRPTMRETRPPRRRQITISTMARATDRPQTFRKSETWS